MALSQAASESKSILGLLDLPAEVQRVIIECVFSAIFRKQHWKEGFSLALAIPELTEAINLTLKHAQHGYAASPHFDSNLHSMTLSPERQEFFIHHWDIWNAFFEAAVTHLSGMQGNEAEIFFAKCRRGINYATIMDLHTFAESGPSREYGTPSLLQWWEQNRSILADRTFHTYHAGRSRSGTVRSLISGIHGLQPFNDSHGVQSL